MRDRITDVDRLNDQSCEMELKVKSRDRISCGVTIVTLKPPGSAPNDDPCPNTYPQVRNYSKSKEYCSMIDLNFIPSEKIKSQEVYEWVWCTNSTYGQQSKTEISNIFILFHFVDSDASYGLPARDLGT